MDFCRQSESTFCSDRNSKRKYQWIMREWKCEGGRWWTLSKFSTAFLSCLQAWVKLKAIFCRPQHLDTEFQNKSFLNIQLLLDICQLGICFGLYPYMTHTLSWWAKYQNIIYIACNSGQNSYTQTMFKEGLTIPCLAVLRSFIALFVCLDFVWIYFFLECTKMT